MGWFELFYDLVVVAAVGYGSHLFIEDPSVPLGTWLAATLVVMFVLWFMTTLHANVLKDDGPWRRIAVLVQMLALAVADLSISPDDGLPTSIGFRALGIAFLSIAVMYAVSGRRGHRDIARVVWVSSAIGGLVLIVGASLPDADVLARDVAVLAVGVLVPIIAVFGWLLPRLMANGSLDEDHLGERMGQLLIIVIGECFVGLLTVLGGRSSIPNPAVFVLAFLVAYAIWATYFKVVPPRGFPRSAWVMWLWLAAYLLLLYGSVAVASRSSVLVVRTWSEVTVTQLAWTGLALAYVVVAMALMWWLPSLGARRRV
ncbi:MAG: low temperature requirement protein A [Candidatus Nanopelagicales bacterium]